MLVAAIEKKEQNVLNLVKHYLLTIPASLDSLRVGTR
jgi:hypothetical protein